jgi:predicted PhzF superfamily epimerase YddE/YHI9
MVAYALANRLIADLPEKAVVKVEQGAELGRPSEIQVFIAHQGGRTSEVRIGGQCQLVGEGAVIAPSF